MCLTGRVQSLSNWLKTRYSLVGWNWKLRSSGTTLALATQHGPLLLTLFSSGEMLMGPLFIILVIIIKLYTDLETWCCGLTTVPFVLLQTWAFQTLPHFPNCCPSVHSSETRIFPFMFLLIFICVYLLMPISLYILILHICVWEILANLGDMDINMFVTVFMNLSRGIFSLHAEKSG